MMKQVFISVTMIFSLLIPISCFADYEYRVNVYVIDERTGQYEGYYFVEKGSKDILLKYAERGKCPKTSSYRSKRYVQRGSTLSYYTISAIANEEFCIIAPGYKSKFVRLNPGKSPLRFELEKL